MAITALPTAPSRARPTEFAAEADTFVAALPAFGTEANTLATDVNAKQVTASSAASTATTQAGIATTKATEASSSASTASTSASTATTQAGIATTKATEASNSAAAAAASAATIDLTAPGPIGGVTPNTGSFTNLSATVNGTTGTVTATHVSNNSWDAPDNGSKYSFLIASTGYEAAYVAASREGSTPGISLKFGTTTNLVGIHATTKMTLDAAGNLGLGVVPSAWMQGGLTKALQVGAYASFCQDNSGNSVVATNAYETGAGWKYTATIPASKYAAMFGEHTWYTAPSGTAGTAITWATSMTLDTSSNLSVSGNITSAGERVGYLGIPQNSKSTDYTLVLTDAGKHILHPSADTTARTFTIPANASVAFPIGSAITFINQNAAGVISISITSDVMRLAGAGTTGTRTLAANGIATAIKLTATEWIISGTGLA